MNNFNKAYYIFKWLPSENASSKITKKYAKKIRQYLHLSAKEYRQILSKGREVENILERLMSTNEWNKIDFSKIPSKAGLIYRNAFARRDILAKKYEAFAKDKNTKVNAEVLYPHDIAHRALNWQMQRKDLDNPERLMLQKYWDNLKDFYNGREENGIAVVDVSGSMSGTPMEAAVSMGAYIADKAHGPFANHFITFSSHPQLVKFEGVDIVDKFRRCVASDWGMNTNVQAVFDMLLDTAKNKHVKPEDMISKIFIFSDMEFDRCVSFNTSKSRREWYSYETVSSIDEINSDLEKIKKQWENEGYRFPKVIFWNLAARQNRIPAIGDGFSYVSGFSPVLVETILGGRDGYDLMISKLVESGRYAAVVA